MALQSLDDYNKDRLDAFKLTEKPHPNGIACPKCGKELLDSNSSVCLTSWPPQYSTHCPACGYTGTRFSLAQPEPEGPSKAELRQIFDDQSGFINDEQVMWWSDFQPAARAVLARWGNL
jgi:hypothetical protein